MYLSDSDKYSLILKSFQDNSPGLDEFLWTLNNNQLGHKVSLPSHKPNNILWR